MELYLCEEESVDGVERFLDLTIKLSPGSLTIREKRRLSMDEIKTLMEFKEQDYTEKLFSRFGIKKPDSYHGYPKGPYYWIDKEVRQAMHEAQLH